VINKTNNKYEKLMLIPDKKVILLINQLTNNQLSLIFQRFFHKFTLQFTLQF